MTASDSTNSTGEQLTTSTSSAAGTQSASPPQFISTTQGAPTDTHPRRGRRRWAGVLWFLHWLLRMGLAIALLPYAWTKIFHVQMGYADYADALVQYGEMSPMGLLWRFMAFSPTVQALAGAAELIALILLLFRRTAWLGGLIAAMDMGIVFLLNLTFDVPVKQLSGAMALAGLILLIPNVPRVVRFLLGRPVGPAVSGVISHNGVFTSITRWASPILAVVIILGSGLASGIGLSWGRPGSPEEISGVYAAEPEGQASAIEGTDYTTDDITQIAFGQIGSESKRMSIRYRNGDYQDGTYTVDGDAIAVKLFPIRKGTQGLIRDHSGTLNFTSAKTGDGTFSLRTEEAELRISNDPERRFIFDRGFRWEPGTPINR